MCLTPFQRKLLTKRLQTESRSEYRRRIQIMLMTDQGKSQSQICADLSCSPETARYWMHIACIGQAHLWDENPIGRPKSVNDRYLNRLKELVGSHPRTCGYPFKRWTAQWLSRQLAQELGIEISSRHVNRLLNQMGLSLRQRPHTTASLPCPKPDQSSQLLIYDLQTTAPDLQASVLNHR